MSRGGYRPQAGRKPGVKETKPRARKKKSPVIDEPVKQKETTKPLENYNPLSYMLKVMNDTTADKEMRARMAIAAAPYVHPRQGEGKGKKDEKDEKAKAAGAGKFAPSAPPIKMVK